MHGNFVILYCTNPECSNYWDVEVCEKKVGEKYSAQVICSNCRTSGPELIGPSSVQDAIDVWNSMRRESKEKDLTEVIELQLEPHIIKWLDEEAKHHNVSRDIVINAILSRIARWEIENEKNSKSLEQ